MTSPTRNGSCDPATMMTPRERPPSTLPTAMSGWRCTASSLSRLAVRRTWAPAAASAATRWRATGGRLRRWNPIAALSWEVVAIRALVAEANLPISIVEEYGETLPFDDDTFDLVYGRQALHHARDLPKLCQEAARVLRPGGHFIATREHVISKPDDLEAFLRSGPLHHLYGGEQVRVLGEYRSAITHSGMSLVKILAPFENVIN